MAFYLAMRPGILQLEPLDGLVPVKKSRENVGLKVKGRCSQNAGFDARSCHSSNQPVAMWSVAKSKGRLFQKRAVFNKRADHKSGLGISWTASVMHNLLHVHVACLQL